MTIDISYDLGTCFNAYCLLSLTARHTKENPPFPNNYNF